MKRHVGGRTQIVQRNLDLGARCLARLLNILPERFQNLVDALLGKVPSDGDPERRHEVFGCGHLGTPENGERQR